MNGKIYLEEIESFKSQLLSLIREINEKFDYVTTVIKNSV